MQRINPDSRQGLLFVLSMLVSLLFTGLPAPTFAAGPSLDKSVNCLTNSAQVCTANNVSPSATGELITLTIAIATGSGPKVTLSSVADSDGNSYTLVAQDKSWNNSSGLWVSDYIYYSTTSTTNAQHTVVTLSAAGFVNTQTYYWSSASTSLISSSTAHCLSSCGVSPSMVTTSTVSVDSNTVLVAVGSAEQQALGPNPPTAGAGFTGNTYCGLGLGSTNDGCTEYKLPVSAGTSNFPETGPAVTVSGWALVGAAFNPSTATAIVIGPCTFSELQCWWYPILFMSLYSGVVLLVGSVMRVSPRGKAHLFLSAITMGSLVAVILGIMNIVFPLLMLALNTIIALRLRG